MRQIIQYQKTGRILIENLPTPIIQPGGVLVRNMFSLISSGTEKTSVETAQASILGKARSRPDLVKQVLDNIKREGLNATYKKVKNRLDNYKELGYSSAGIVLESNVSEFKPGDKIACGGSAFHAEIIFVAKNLAVKIPDNVSLGDAAYTTLGSVALQGIRQAELRIGEYVAVLGLGLIGLITLQIAKANGCKVIGLDINDRNFELAKTFGCDLCAIISNDSLNLVNSFTKSLGVDATIITASTKSNEPLALALEITRKKGKVVIVGSVGMNIPRSPFYEKEIDLRISCSYGPGRYDNDYEQKGVDYPYPYVRWTENRNMSAILELISVEKLNVSKLTSHKIPIQDGIKAYDLITGKIPEHYLGILISYGYEVDNTKKRKYLNYKAPLNNNQTIIAGFLGAGNFAQSYLLPNLSGKVRFKIVVTTKPINSKSVAEKCSFESYSSDPNDIFSDDEINTVFITSHHNSHASYVIKALKNGKNIFVEKPLAINENELDSIIKSYGHSIEDGFTPSLMVGYNRRFSKTIQDIRNFFNYSLEPYFINYRINAGVVARSHWINDPTQGGRIIGEVCHFIDTCKYICGSEVESISAFDLETKNKSVITHDNVSITLKFKNGSIANIQYLANGDKSLPKEYCEVFCNGKTAIMDNFQRSYFYEDGKKITKKYNGSKGHEEEINHFINLVLGKEKHILELQSILDTTQTTFKILEVLSNNKMVLFNV